MGNFELLVTGYSQENSCEFLKINGEFSVIYRKAFDKIKNASWISKADENLVLVSEESEDYGKIHLTDISKETVLRTFDTPLKGIVHTCFSTHNRMIIASSYTDGGIVLINIDNGEISSLKEGGRTHCTALDKEEKILYSANIESDKIFIYDLELKRQIGVYEFEQGTGIRHILVRGEKLYGVSEYSNEIFEFEIGSSGLLKFVKNVSTIKKSAVKNYASGLALCGNALWVANRGENTITSFHINDLVLKSVNSCEGSFPRDIKISDEKYLFVCNEASNELCIFELGDKLKLIKKIEKEKINCVVQV